MPNGRGGTNEGSGPKLRAPVFLGLRDDKDPKECLLEESCKAKWRRLRADDCLFCLLDVFHRQ